MRHKNLRRTVLLLFVFLATTGEAADRDAIWEANKRAAVQIKVSGRDSEGAQVPVRTGSGIIVHPNGTIVTALHVVGSDDQWFEIPGSGGERERKVEVFGLDTNEIMRDLAQQAFVTPLPTLDIALLEINATGLPAATFAEQRPNDLASIVAILWAPDSKRPQPVSAELVPTDRGRNGDVLTAQLAVHPGNSGSAAFGTDQRLVGIVTNQLSETQALIIPVDRIMPHLPSILSDPHKQPVTPALPGPPRHIVKFFHHASLDDSPIAQDFHAMVRHTIQSLTDVLQTELESATDASTISYLHDIAIMALPNERTPQTLKQAESFWDSETLQLVYGHIFASDDPVIAQSSIFLGSLRGSYSRRLVDLNHTLDHSTLPASWSELEFVFLYALGMDAWLRRQNHLALDILGRARQKALDIPDPDPSVIHLRDALLDHLPRLAGTQ